MKINNKEDLKKYNIICTNKKEVQKTMDFLKNLDFEVEDTKPTQKDYIIVYFEKESYKFICDNWCKLIYENISFYRFKNLVKKFLKEKKLEDFEVAEDGRIIKINNYKSKEKIFIACDWNNRNQVSTSNEVEDFTPEFLDYSLKYGLAYATKQARDRAQFKLEIETKLKNIAERLNDGEKIDWDNYGQCKYSIYCKFINKEPFLGYHYSHDYQGIIHCLSDKFLDEAIKEIGEDNLIKYFKGE